MSTFELFEVSQGAATRLPYSSFVFSGGEIQVKLDTANFFEAQEILIRGNILSSQSLMELALLVDALRRRYMEIEKLHLVSHYLPYARQDRVCAPGEALSLKVLADFINVLKFTTVTVWDVHSDVSLALIDRVINVEPEFFLSSADISWPNTILVAPDGGALKKTFKVAQSFKVRYVTAEKHRDPNNGKITGTTVHREGLSNADLSKDFLVVDDICDGGRTFIELAKVLQKQVTGKLLLYVTHGIFSQGLSPLLEWFDHIYVANCFLEPYGGPDWKKVTLLTKEN